MKRIHLLILSILFLAFSCSKNEEAKNEIKLETYQKEGLSFDLPAEWKVKQDYTNEKGRYLELDKYSNYKVTNTMMIGILEGKQVSDSIMSSQINQLKDFYKKVNFKIVEDKKNSKIGKYNASSTTYEADDTKNKIYGKVYITQENEKTLSIQIVENKPNTDMSEYDTIFNTLTLK